MREFFRANIKYVGLVLIYILIGIAFTFGYYQFSNKDATVTSNNDINNNEEMVDYSIKTSENTENLVTPKKDKAAYLSDYEVIHNMTNTVIVSDVIWKTEKITRNKIDEMIKEFKGYDDIIVKYLNEWNNLDFSRSVEFHNYVWNKLDGTIGKATGLNNEKINLVIESLK